MGPKMLRSLLVCGCLAAIVGLFATAAPVKDDPPSVCGTSDPSYGFKLTGATIDPNPAQKGKNITYTMTGTVVKDVTDGTIEFNLLYKLAGKWVHGPFHKKYNICDENTCPLKAGTISMSLHSDIPAFVPGGEYKVELPVVDGTGKNITLLTSPSRCNCTAAAGGPARRLSGAPR